MTRQPAAPQSALYILLALAASTAGCAMNTDGGELTNETREAQQNPTGGVSTGKPPQVLDILVEIGAGGGHTCVRKADGRVWCWGRNDSGQSGGTPVPVYPGYPSGVAQPVRVVGLSAAHLAIGYDHSCALTSVGEALCWGNNFNGGLGSNSTIPVGTPAPVGNFNGAPITFSNLGAGEHATCGIQAGTGTVFCWGELTSPGAATFQSPNHLLSPSGYELDNASGVVTGRLGGCIIWGGFDAGCWTQVNSTGVSNEVVTGWNNVSNGHVSTAKDFTCADLNNGTVGCFGMDNLGQLGDGMQGSTTFNTNTIGQAVGGGMQLHGVSAGGRHACALDPSNNLVCWGSNDVGQLGTGTNANVQPPTQVMAPSGVHFRAVAAGEEHTCAIGTDDHVYCWGSNVYAQIGNGAHNTPNAIFWTVTQAIDPT